MPKKNSSMSIEKLKEISPIILRIGISILFFWFGFSQVQNPSIWTQMIPQYALSITHLSATTIVLINGIFELTFALLLIIGLFTRATALILSLHLFHISTIVGYNDIGIRDLALAIATLSIFFYGADKFSLDFLFRKNKNRDKK